MEGKMAKKEKKEALEIIEKLADNVIENDAEILEYLSKH